MEGGYITLGMCTEILKAEGEGGREGATSLEYNAPLLLQEYSL